MCGVCGTGAVRAPWEGELFGDTTRERRRRAAAAGHACGNRLRVHAHPAGYQVATPTGVTRICRDLDGLAACLLPRCGHLFPPCPGCDHDVETAVVALTTPEHLQVTAGESLIQLGETFDEFGGSEWAHVVHGHLGGRPPKVDLARERLLADVLVASSRDGLVSAAHDLSDGGLAQAVVEMMLVGQTGARLLLDPGTDAFVQLFSESAGRVLVAVPRTEELRFTELCSARGLPWSKTGVVDPESDALEIQDVATITIADLRAAWESTLPALFDEA